MIRNMTEKKKIDLITSFCSVVVMIIFTILFFNFVKDGIEKNETGDCLKLQSLAKEMRKDLFFITPDQSDQCKSIGIKIDAPIKKVSI